MRVRCVSTNLEGPSREILIISDYSKSLRLGTSYVVYAMSIWEGILNYLILEREADLPFWHPAELFEVEDEMLPLETYFKYFGGKDARGVNALWGYKEMIFDDSHYLNLIEREKKAIKVFLSRKQEIDEENVTRRP